MNSSSPQPQPSPLIQDPKRRLWVSLIMVAIVVVIVTGILVYMFVFFPRVNFNDRVMLTTEQSVNQPMLRYGLNIQNIVPGSNAVLQPNGLARLGLMPVPGSKSGGQIQTQNQFMIWEPSTNLYLRSIHCLAFKNESQCETATTYDNKSSACTWHGKSCGGIEVNFIFQSLPKNFEKNIGSKKDADMYLNGFLFEFRQPDTKDKSVVNVQTNQNFLLWSVLSDCAVMPNMSTSTLANACGPSPAWNLNWKILK